VLCEGKNLKHIREEDTHMAVSAVLNFRPRDGRLGEQLESLKAVKRLVERAGGTFRVHRQLFGAQANTLVAVSEYKDWNAFAKLRSDSEFLQLVDRIRSSANPAADIVGGELFEELPI